MAPSQAAGARIAIATTVWALSMSSRDQVCGIVKWCQDATRFAALPFLRDRAEVLIVTNDAKFVNTECAQFPQIRVIPYGQEVVDLSKRWVEESYDRSAERHRVKTVLKERWLLNDKGFTLANIVKWDVLRHTEYESIFLVDNDIDFWHPARKIGPEAHLEATQHAWTELYDRFMRSDALILANMDPQVILNGGLLLLKPRQEEYELGVRLLRTMRFNITHGPGLIGRPRDLLNASDLELYKEVHMVKYNTWNVVNGDADQGMISAVYAMLARRHAVPTYSPYKVHHFWASSKPWMRKSSCYFYFEAAGLVSKDKDGKAVFQDKQPNRTTTCWRLLRRQAKMMLGIRNYRCRGMPFKVF